MDETTQEPALPAAVAGEGPDKQLEDAGAMRLITPGGRFHVHWDEGGSASAMGQLAFFAEFLEVSGLFTRWAEGCPMDYTSPGGGRCPGHLIAVDSRRPVALCPCDRLAR